MFNVSDFELFLMPVGHEMLERKEDSRVSLRSWTMEETNSDRIAFAEEEN